MRFVPFLARPIARQELRTITITRRRGLHSTAKHASEAAISIPLVGVINVNVFPYCWYILICRLCHEYYPCRGLSLSDRFYAWEREIYMDITLKYLPCLNHFCIKLWSTNGDRFRCSGIVEIIYRDRYPSLCIHSITLHNNAYHIIIYLFRRYIDHHTSAGAIHIFELCNSST